MATFQNVMDDARIILNDEVSELNPIPRYTEAQLLSYARSALIEARRVRPDLFLSNLTTSFASYTVSTTIPISDDYLLAMVDYVVHRAELRDDEFAVDGQKSIEFKKS